MADDAQRRYRNPAFFRYVGAPLLFLAGVAMFGMASIIIMTRWPGFDNVVLGIYPISFALFALVAENTTRHVDLRPDSITSASCFGSRILRRDQIAYCRWISTGVVFVPTNPKLRQIVVSALMPLDEAFLRWARAIPAERDVIKNGVIRGGGS
jgi:hypothetical protein